MKSKKENPAQLSLFPESAFADPEAVASVEENTKSAGMLKINPQPAYDFNPLFYRLSQSAFRSRFHLGFKDRQYIKEKGIEVIRQHAADFVSKRLAPAYIPNDGKQTPMQGHPVFLAQHATGCCCRGCFQKWHHIPAGRDLTAEEQHYAVCVLMEWINRELGSSDRR